MDFAIRFVEGSKHLCICKFKHKERRNVCASFEKCVASSHTVELITDECRKDIEVFNLYAL